MNADPVAAALDETYQRTRTAQAAASTAQIGAAAGAAELAHDAWARAGALAAASPAAPGYACAKGCRWCCHQPIFVAAPEAIALAGELRARFGAHGLDLLGQALAQRAARASGEGSAWVAAWLKARVPCAFLAGDGSCAVHLDRPTVCRGWHSLSRNACEERYIDDAAAQPPIDRASHLAANAVLHGLADAAHAAGRDDRLYELHGAVLAALADPSAAAARWAAGEQVFPGIAAVSAARR